MNSVFNIYLQQELKPVTSPRVEHRKCVFIVCGFYIILEIVIIHAMISSMLL
jgi:hypothetical protein